MENTLIGFTKYVGQAQLIFSSIQGIAEIYKIHGSVESPESIVINEADYIKFDRGSAYLAAKLMTINLRVAALDDKRVADEELVIAIGKMSDLGLKGLSGIDSNEWYRNIVIEDLDVSSDELLEYAYHKVLKQNSGRLPVNKYLSESKKDFPDCRELAKKQNFDTIISNTIKKNRRCLGNYTSVGQIWKQEKDSVERATRLMSHLKEEQFNAEELEAVLHDLFNDDVNILQNADQQTRINIRRLIMIYDYLKWGK